MSSDRSFVHLHCHSHYSLLDGASSISRLIARTREHGMNALALTDHGNLHGALEFWRAATKEGVKPIIGYEAYVAPGSRLDRGTGGPGERNYHLTLLCENATGFRNLVKMASAAALEGFYFKPRIDLELLEAHREGIICLSGCVSSQFSQAILNHHGAGADEMMKEAGEVASWFHRVFGDRYFIEIMNNGVGIQQICLDASVELANRMGLPLVATSDCHYVDRSDADAQDVMLCINTGRFRTDTNRMRMDGDQYFLRAPSEMYEKFPGLEDAVARSQEIADRIDIQLELGKRHFPVFQLPDERTPAELLRDLCVRGLLERYAGDSSKIEGDRLDGVVQQRLDRELSVIEKLGFEHYFLIVWDFVREARERKIPATARGSGVGALVSYALWLSHVCPIRFDLLFERFMDESRVEAPDIDIDFCMDRRGEIIEYVRSKYGAEMVAQIGTFGTLGARAAIKDVGRALGLPLARVNQVTALVPSRPGIRLADAIEEVPDLRNVYENDAEFREVIEYALRLEGLARNVGTHAAAVVIGDRPLTEYLPLGRATGNDEVITQWAMDDVEAIGLLKMDFLGLKNLTVLSNAVDVIEEAHGERIDLNRLPLDDEKTFDLLQRAETRGVFQMESGGIRDLLQKMKPDHFRDLIATNALYRPGPLEGGMVQQYIDVKRGRKPAEYQHPVLEEILAETHGVMVYQEQVMRILNRLGDIPLAEAYTCIKAISKKKEATIARNREQFLAGAIAHGLKKPLAIDLWNMILKFAGYGFNKSHSTAYALIAWQTAWLKAHYPREYMAAVLTGDIAHRNFVRKDSTVEHLEDCQRMEIEVVPPSVNSSNVRFSVDEGKIHFALSAIKGCGESAANAIVAEREKDGPFRDLFDFCERVENTDCGRSTIESLVKAGAMDCFGANRNQLLTVIDRAIQSGAAAAADRRSGQKSLFGDEPDGDDGGTGQVALPSIPELDDLQKLAAEKEVLGFYLTSHPLREHEPRLAPLRTHETIQLAVCRDREPVTMAGMISSIRYSHIKRPREPGAPTRYVMFDLEDLQGNVRCILWPTEFATCAELVKPDAVVVARGVVDKRGGGDEVNLVVNELIPIEQLGELCTAGIHVTIDEREHGRTAIDGVYEIVRGYVGSRRLELTVRTRDGSEVEMVSRRVKVAVNEEMRERLVEFLGAGNVRAITVVPRATTGNENARRRGPAPAAAR